MEAAHRGLIVAPSDDPEAACGMCHSDVTENYTTSIHYTLAGMENGLRALTADHPRTEEAFDKYCYSCHATCGTCHVAKPAAADGGLIDGHKFFSQPREDATCAVCHGGRVANEAAGGIEGFPGDVHAERGMGCTVCHSSAGLHGDGTAPANRHEAPGKPECLDCHPTAAPGAGGVEAHNAHAEGTLDCYVCHATVNKSCFNCHVGEGATSKVDFKIGLNTREDWPYRYSVVRHMPQVESMLDPFEPGMMRGYDSVSNWKTSMVHNIQRITPRNKTCQSCHNNSRIFLTDARLDKADSAASSKAVVNTLPPKL